MDLQTIYNHLVDKDADRSTHLDYAEECAKLTIPTLAPKGSKIDKAMYPHTDLGTMAVRSLASSEQKSLMPPGVQYFDADLAPEHWEYLAAQGVAQEEIDGMRKALDAREQSVIKSLTRKVTRSRFGGSLRRNLVEGTTGYINRPNELQVFPLRSLVVERDSSGKPRFAIFHEEIPQDILKLEKGKDPGAPINVYTLANYENEQVWQQKDDGAAQQLDNIDPAKEPDRAADRMNIKQFIVGTGEIPDVGNYAPGYAYNFLRTFQIVNHGEASLGEAMAAAAWNRPRVKPGSAISENLDNFFKEPSGKPFLGEEGDIELLSFQNKLGDWAFVNQYLQIKAQAASKAFAMGLKDRPVTGDTTATEVLAILDELHTQTHDLVSTHEETIILPLIESEMYLQDQVAPVFPQLGADALRVIKVVITSGVSAVQKQRDIMKFILQILPALVGMDPKLRVKGKEAADMFANSMLLETGGTYESLSQDQYLAELQARAAATAKPTGESGTVMTNGGPQRSNNIQPGSPGATNL